jgi:hypothetical protein
MKRGPHHYLSKNPLYACWYNIKTRCYNPANPGYERYGARGIRLAPQWENDRLRFVRDVLAEIGEKPNSLMTLDRIDNNGDYVPGNLRWATFETQQINSRPTKRVKLCLSNHLVEVLHSEAKRLSLRPAKLLRNLIGEKLRNL